VGDWSYLHTRETGVADSPTAGARTTRGRIALEDFSGSRPRLLDDGRTVISGYGTNAAQQPQLLRADRSLSGTRIDSSRNYQTATTANGRFAALTRLDRRGEALDDLLFGGIECGGLGHGLVRGDRRQAARIVPATGAVSAMTAARRSDGLGVLVLRCRPLTRVAERDLGSRESRYAARERGRLLRISNAKLTMTYEFVMAVR
jgi:hypothetical protein